MKHHLYETGDADAPDAVKDRNGEVVLGLCRRCGKGEAELDGPCEPVVFVATEEYEHEGETLVAIAASFDGARGAFEADNVRGEFASDGDGEWCAPSRSVGGTLIIRRAKVIS